MTTKTMTQETHICENCGATSAAEMHCVFNAAAEFELCFVCQQSLATCCECSDVLLADDDSAECDGKTYCQQCADDTLETCDRCNELASSLTGAFDTNGCREDVCDSCLEDIGTCDQCREYCDTHETDDGYDLCYDCYADCHYCEYCDERRRYGCDCSDDSGELSEYGEYESAPHSKMILPSASALPGVFFGIEFEFSYCGDTPRDTAREMQSNYFPTSHYGWTSDCSLERGVEMPSAPMTFDYWKTTQYKPLREFFSRFDEMDMSTRRAGMHIHVSKDPLSKSARGLLARMIYTDVETSELAKFASRRNGDFYYCSFDGISGVSSRFDEVLGCYEPATSRDTEKTFEDDSRTNKYSALHIHPSGHTLEFRLCAAPSTFGEFASSLEFVASLVEFAQLIADGASNQSLLSQYYDFVCQHRARFRHFADTFDAFILTAYDAKALEAKSEVKRKREMLAIEQFAHRRRMVLSTRGYYRAHQSNSRMNPVYERQYNDAVQRMRHMQSYRASASEIAELQSSIERLDIYMDGYSVYRVLPSSAFAMTFPLVSYMFV